MKWLIENEWLISPVNHLHINSKTASPRNSSLSLCRILSRTTKKVPFKEKYSNSSYVYPLKYLCQIWDCFLQNNTEFALLIQINYVFCIFVVSCRVFGVEETVAGKVLCSNVNIAPCLFNLSMRSFSSYTITTKISKHPKVWHVFLTLVIPPFCCHSEGQKIWCYDLLRSIFLFVYMLVCLTVCLSDCESVCLSVYLSINHCLSDYTTCLAYFVTRLWLVSF